MSVEKKNSSLTYLFTISFVAIVIVVGLVLSSSTNLQGAAVHTGPAKTFSPKCLDDDENNDYFFYGTVHFGSTNYYDFCKDEWNVRQFYCSSTNSKRATKSHKCPTGCSGGVCIKDNLK